MSDWTAETWRGFDPKVVRSLMKLAFDEADASRCAVEVTGVIYPEDEAGTYGAELATAHGRMSGRLLLARPRASSSSSTRPGMMASDVLWGRVRDDAATLQDRADALSELISREDPSIAAYIVSELGVADRLGEWSHLLVYATEHVQFVEAKDRTKLKEGLLHKAVALHDSPRPGSEPALWASLRRYATLIPECEIDSFGYFLDTGSPIATRQVVMQCIQSVFTASAPSQTNFLGQLEARVAELCSKYIDPDTLVSTEIASLALNAFLAIAVLASPHAVSCAQNLKRCGRAWLVRRASKVLGGVRSRWQSRETPSLSVIDECLAVLRAG